MRAAGSPPPPACTTRSTTCSDRSPLRARDRRGIWAAAALALPFTRSRRWPALECLRLGLWAIALAARHARRRARGRRAPDRDRRSRSRRRRARGACHETLGRPSRPAQSGNESDADRRSMKSACDGMSRLTHERSEEPGKQDCRPGRRHVQPCLPLRGAPGRDRAQARPRDGGAQVVLGVAHVRAERVPGVPLPARSRAFRRLRGGADRRAGRLPARARAPRAPDAAVAAGDRVRDRRPARARRVRHPDPGRPARGRAGERAGRGPVRAHDGLQQRRARGRAARGARPAARPDARCS